jgi:hypothetical protein
MFKKDIDSDDLANTLFVVQLIYGQTDNLCMDPDTIKFFVGLLENK